MCGVYLRDFRWKCNYYYFPLTGFADKRIKVIGRCGDSGHGKPGNSGGGGEEKKPINKYEEKSQTGIKMKGREPAKRGPVQYISACNAGFQSLVDLYRKS